ncbi:MAG TPA: tyrosine-protein phosphatase [Vicinamibacterales bacterium]|nr:tyrosine-protein phosphatase [Vicinamibacterales bacterium]
MTRTASKRFPPFAPSTQTDPQDIRRRGTLGVFMRIGAYLLAALVASASPASAQLSPSTVPFAIGIANFGKINDTYYRGAQPKARDYSDLARLGIRTVIDLTRDGESREPSAVAALGMRFFRIPMTTSDRPDAAAVDEFLSIVNNPANQPVYVHCQGGRHRTGLMTALYRLTHDGWSADRAFDEMRQYEFEKGFVSHAVLKNFLYDFYRAAPHPTS